MTYIIPTQNGKKLLQTNKNDVSGNLYVTKNINLDDEASIKLSPPAVAVMTQDDDADFDEADAMFIGDGKLYVNSDELFAGDIDHSPLSNRSGDTNAPSPTVEDDVTFFNEVQVVSDGSVVKYEGSSGVWTSISGLTATGTSPTALANFDAQSSLLRGRDNKVDRISTSWTVATTLTIPSVYKVSSMVCNGTIAYIGTRHDASGEARLFLWDGNGTTASESYGVDAFEITSVKAYDSTVVLMTSDGRLLRFTGGGFETLAVLPIYNTEYDWSNDLNDYSAMANRGMIVDGSIIYMVLSSQITSRWKYYMPNFVGGVWCYDPAVGLYHRHAPSYTRITSDTSIATTDVNTSTNEITVGTAPETGTPCIYNPFTTPYLTPLKQGRAYYVIKVDATTIKLADSEADALAGTAISLTSTGNNNQELYFYNTNDYGFTYTDNRCSIAVLSDTMRDDRFAGRLAFSSTAGSKTTLGDVTVLNTPCPYLTNRGYFITPKMYSPNVEDKYTAIHLKYKKLVRDDKIVIKYRTAEKADYPITLDESDVGSVSTGKGTWTSTTTFTTVKDLSQVVEGEEIEIVYGVGAGFTAHVSSISESSGTYTVTLDEAFIFASANDVMLFVVDNWTKLYTITPDKQVEKIRLPKVGASEFIQLKVELRGVGTCIRELQVLNQNHKQLQ